MVDGSHDGGHGAAKFVVPLICAIFGMPAFLLSCIWFCAPWIDVMHDDFNAEQLKLGSELGTGASNRQSSHSGLSRNYYSTYQVETQLSF